MAMVQMDLQQEPITAIFAAIRKTKLVCIA
jgi:hypothetical protein